MVDPRALVRAQLWWSAKVLPVVGVGALASLAAGTAPSEGLARFVAMTFSAIGIAASAHLINDWADIEADRQADKPNAASGVSPAVRAAALAFGLALGVAPWLFVDASPAVLVLLVALLAIPVAYSSPPLRLKARAAAGVAADAANAHVVPTAFAVLLLSEPGERGGLWRLALGGSLVWATGFGVRSILVHQLSDEANDRAAGVRTFVIRHGPVRAGVVGRRAFGLEIFGLAVMWVAAAWSAPGAGAFFAAYLGLWLLHLRWDDRLIDPVPRRTDAYMPLAEYYEVWPALVLSLALVVRNHGWWPLPVAITVLFWGAVSKQVIDLGTLIRDAVNDFRAWSRNGVNRLRWLAIDAVGWIDDLGQTAAGRIRQAANWTAWRIRDVPWKLRRLWFDGPVGRARYAARRGVTQVWLFVRRQGRRFSRIVLRRNPHAES